MCIYKITTTVKQPTKIILHYLS